MNNWMKQELPRDNPKINSVFMLMEVGMEGAHVYGVYDTRRAAIKSGLLLVRKRCQADLDLYRQTGEDAAEDCYRNQSKFDNERPYLWVEEEKVWSESDLITFK